MSTLLYQKWSLPLAEWRLILANALAVFMTIVQATVPLMSEDQRIKA
ncbi:MAG: hypothetical protein WHV66_14525 [Anaerolineales bacterium]